MDEEEVLRLTRQLIEVQEQLNTLNQDVSSIKHNISKAITLSRENEIRLLSLGESNKYLKTAKFISNYWVIILFLIGIVLYRL